MYLQLNIDHFRGRRSGVVELLRAGTIGALLTAASTGYAEPHVGDAGTRFGATHHEEAARYHVVEGDSTTSLVPPVSLQPRRFDLTWVRPSVPYPYSVGESWTVPIAHSLSVMTAVRLSEAILYPDPFAETDPSVWGRHYEEAFTMPPVFDADRDPFEWDGDPWPINVVGHALLGSEMYTRMRICRHGPLASIAFTAAGAVVWDYAFEGNGVRPSALDLIYTPLAGALLGEGRYWIWRGAATLSSPTWSAVLTLLADPLGEFGRAVGSPC